MQIPKARSACRLRIVLALLLAGCGVCHARSVAAMYVRSGGCGDILVFTNTYYAL